MLFCVINPVLGLRIFEAGLNLINFLLLNKKGVQPYLSLNFFFIFRGKIFKSKSEDIE